MTASQFHFRVITLSELDARAGKPLVDPKKLVALSRQGKPLENGGATDAFWGKVHIKTPQECWMWSLKLTVNGAGLTRLPVVGRLFKTSAARVALLTVQGHLDDNLFVLHTCDNGGCCNPRHLYEGTQQRNQRDCVERGRSPVQKLTVEQVREIRETYDGSYGIQARLMEAYNVSRPCIYSILKRRTWKWI